MEPAFVLLGLINLVPSIYFGLYMYVFYRDELSYRIPSDTRNWLIFSNSNNVSQSEHMS